MTDVPPMFLEQHAAEILAAFRRSELDAIDLVAMLDDFDTWFHQSDSDVARNLRIQARKEHSDILSAFGTTVSMYRSDTDKAIIVFIDTEYEPDGSDGSTGLRVYVNDGDAFIGKKITP